MNFRMLPLLVAVAPLWAAMAGACSEDTINTNVSGDGVVTGVINYNGTTPIYRIALALLTSDTYPPTTMPAKMAYQPDTASETPLAFPFTYTLTDLADGTWWLAAYGDADPDDGPMQTAGLDPGVTMAYGPFTITGGSTATQNLLLEDGSITGDGDVDGTEDTEYTDEASHPKITFGEGGSITPAAGKAALSGTVRYRGAKTGTIMVTGFSTNPPSGPPSLYVYSDSDTPQLPYTFEKSNVNPMTMYLLVYIDVDSSDGMGNQVGDPTSGDFYEVTFEADKSYVLEVTVVD